MSTFFFALLSAVAFALCAVRDDTPTARSRQQICASLRRLGWRRVAWLTVQAVVGVALVLLVAAVRTGLYGAFLAIAAAAALVASLVAIDRRPIRVHRQEIRA
jgi:integral membrane sensor domain MASE1